MSQSQILPPVAGLSTPGLVRQSFFDVRDPRFAGGASPANADNSAAINAAITAAAAAGGGMVYLPALYPVKQVVLASNVLLFSDVPGAGVQALVQPVSTSPYVPGNAGGVNGVILFQGCSYAGLRGITVIGPGGPTAPATAGYLNGPCVWITETTTAETGASDSGPSHDLTFIECHFDQGGHTNFYSYMASAVRCIGCTFTNAAISSAGGGGIGVFLFRGCTTHQFVDCRIDGTDAHGFAIDAGTNSTGTYALAHESHVITNLVVANTGRYCNTSGVTYGDGIFLKGAWDSVITGVTMTTIGLLSSLALPTAPTIASTTGGSLSAGTYKYAFAVQRSGMRMAEEPCTGTVFVTGVAAGGQVTVTVPVSPLTGVSARTIYRTAAGGSQLYLLTTINDNTTTTFTDTIADATIIAGNVTPVLPSPARGITCQLNQNNVQSTRNVITDVTMVNVATAALNIQGTQANSIRNVKARNVCLSWQAAYGLVLQGGNLNTTPNHAAGGWVPPTTLPNVTDNLLAEIEITQDTGLTSYYQYGVMIESMGGTLDTYTWPAGTLSSSTPVGDGNWGAYRNRITEYSPGPYTSALSTTNGSNVPLTGPNANVVGGNGRVAINPAAPQAGTAQLAGTLQAVTVAATGALCAPRLIGSPSTTNLPVHTASVATDTNPFYGCLFNAGQNLAVPCFGAGKIDLFDLTQTPPVKVVSIAPGGTPIAIQPLTISGTPYLVAVASSGTLYIYNVSGFTGNPGNTTTPTQTGTVALGGSNGPTDVACWGGRFCAVTLNAIASVTIYDLIAPATPSHLATATVSAAPYGICTYGANGNQLAVASTTAGVLSFIDASTAFSPVVNPLTVTLGGTAYLVSQYDTNTLLVSMQTSKVAVVDVASALAPTLVKTVASSGSVARMPAVQGTLAWWPNFSSNKVDIFDLTRTDAPVLVTSLALAGNGPASVFLANGNLYVLENTASSLEVFTVQPIQVASAQIGAAGFYGVVPQAQPQRAGTETTAGATYGANEQAMLQDVFGALRTLGLLK